MDENTKKYVLISTDENGHEVRQYNDGYIRNERGQIIVLPENAPVITSENARDYHRMRKEKILNAIEKRVMDVTKTNIPADAIAHIVAKRAEIAMNDSTRIGNEAAKIVLQALDAYQTKETDAIRTNVLRHEYAIDAETMRLLESIAQSRRDNSEYIDASSTNVLGDDSSAMRTEDE